MSQPIDENKTYTKEELEKLGARPPVSSDFKGYYFLEDDGLRYLFKLAPTHLDGPEMYICGLVMKSKIR